MKGYTLDAGGLIAVDRRDRRVLVFLELARQEEARITIPATAFAQVIRNPSRQVWLRRLIADPRTDLVSLDTAEATAVGLLLARTRTADIVDAHVVLCAQRTGQAVITSDARDLRRLSADLPLISI